jgi:DNA-binding transcriptional LysR family regulator
MLTNIGLRHLRSFVVLADELHFAHAAAALHISQPALSQTIRQLEFATGLHLVRRTTRAVELTDAGRLFRDDAVRVLTEFDLTMERALEMAAGRRGKLHVGYSIGAGVDIVPSVLREFAAAFPDVEVEIREFDWSQPAAGLDDGQTDVAIVRPPLDIAEGTAFFTLATEPCVACVYEGHPLADRDEVSVLELLDEPIVAAPGSGVWRDYWIACEYRNGRPPNVVAEAATFEAELQTVAAGRGISITAGIAARYYARPGLRFPVITDIPLCRVAVALPADPTPAARHFAELAVSMTRDLGATANSV